MRRPVVGVSAVGIVSPLGVGKKETIARLTAGTRDGLVLRGGLLPDRSMYVGAVDAVSSIPFGGISRNARLMLVALDEIRSEIDEMKRRFGDGRIAVILGTSTSGIAEGERAFADFRKDNVWPEGYSYCQQELGALAAVTADALGIRGPAYTVATACSSSAKVFATARRLLVQGVCDAVVVGGADTLCQTTLNGFGSLEALSGGLCNPFSRNRDGINIGEAAVAFLVTRDDAPVVLRGIGESSDAYHLSAPDPAGRGAIASMKAALDNAGAAPADIAYVNLHGTGTPLNDAMEGAAIMSLFGDAVPCSSTKGMTGHTLGAAGACEAAFLWLMLHPEFTNGLLPPHMWDREPDPGIPKIRLVEQGVAIPKDGTLMMSNSFAFGGNNVSLIFGRGS